MIRRLLIPLLLAAALAPAEEPAKTLYCVGYAHLDTQWRWDYTTTIGHYLKATLEQNFDRFEKFPGYVFNFTGSRRYQLMKEYYPAQFERMRQYIAAGRWHVAGSAVDEGDSNVPSPESMLRHVLYGNGYFRREFGKESVDFMLPDSFGFPASLPSVLAHCGIKGFSTQKLVWGSAVGIPFNLGTWIGPDGRSVAAAFNPGSYNGAIDGRADKSAAWAARIDENGTRYGVFADFHYYGVGDTGGAPREEDVRNYTSSAGAKDGLYRVKLASSDAIFRDLTPAQLASLPSYKGDLLLTEHSAGSLTSEAYMKRWNRKNEALADAAERAAVAAHWLGGAPYPRERLTQAWTRILGSQMHDILPGTCIPVAYRYAWNDEILAQNLFASVLSDSVGAVARGLDTDVGGVPLVVYNPLAIGREDTVEATVTLEEGGPGGVRALGPDGKEVPVQVLSRDGNTFRLLLLCRVAPLSFTVFEIRPGPAAASGPERLENDAYRVAIDANGDVASIVDRQHGNRELLAAPARLVFTHERPRNWPAWNMDWADRVKPPLGRVDGPATVRFVEHGPVRAAVEIVREARNSVFRQTVRLTRGSRLIEFHNAIDWQSASCALRASFPLAVSNPKATYNLGLGTIERGNNDPKKYEVPSREWFDLTDASGDYGVTVLEDCKYGSDKPSDREVRLTLLYTPGVRDSYLDQHSQDWGRHEMVYALCGHRGDWRKGGSEWQGRRLNQPLRAFVAPRHPGPLGRQLSLASVSSPQVDLRALKRAEEGDEVIVRLQELSGRTAHGVKIRLAGAVAEAREVDGQERTIGKATVSGGELAVNLAPYAPRSFAIRLAPPAAALAPPRSTAVELPFDTDAVSGDANRADGEGKTYPAEMLPRAIVSEGIRFEIGPMADGEKNALACRGQTVALPEGDYDRIYLLASAEADVAAPFVVGGARQVVEAQCWTGILGQWDSRVWDTPFQTVDFRCSGRVTHLDPAFLKRAPVAWFCTHRHDPRNGNEAYQFSYLFKHALVRPAGATALTLPDEPRLRIFALTVGTAANDLTAPAAPLHDEFAGGGPIPIRHVYPPPKKPVYEGLEPVAEVVTDRRERFEDLAMGAPSAKDDAQGLAFRFVTRDDEWHPHPGSGAVGDTLPRLSDGEVAANDDDTSRCVWYDNEGRFHVDLKRSREIRAVHTYSWHRTNRAPQFFSLWGSNAAVMPSPAIEFASREGWTLLALVDTRRLGNGGKHGSAIVPKAPANALGPFRHLLWIAEEVGEGTFFTEIDVDLAR